MITLINDAETTGVSENTTIVIGSDEGNHIHSFQIVMNGSPSALIVDIEATITGTDFTCIARHVLSGEELDAGTALFHVTSKPVPVIRANITKLEGGVSPQVSVYYFKGK